MFGLTKLHILLDRQKYRQFGVMVVWAFIIGLFETVGLSSLYPILDGFIRPESFLQQDYVIWVVTHFPFVEEFGVLRFFIGCALAAFIGKFLLIALGKYITFDLTVSFHEYLATKFFKAYAHAEYLEVSKRSNAHFSEYIFHKIHMFCEHYLQSIVLFLSSVFMILSVSLMLFFLNPYIFIFATIAAGVFLFLMRLLIGKLLRRAGAQFEKEREKNLRSIEQGLNPSKFRFISGKSDYFLENFQESLQLFLKMQKLRLFFSTMPRYVLEVSVVSLGLIALFFMTTTTFNIQENLALLGLYAIAGMRFLPIIGGMGTQYSVIMNLQPTLDALCDEVRQVETFNIKERQLNVPELTFETSLCLQEVCFAYNAEKSNISDVSLELKRGEKVAIVGGSGAGKTTLVDLIVGLYHPISGDIKVDGQTIFENRSSWWQKIAYIEQDAYLIDGSLRQNIAYTEAENQIDWQRLEQAIDFAQLRNVVTQHPDGVEQNIGLNGAKLSGGQRQRLALARAFYKKAELIILDESTSSLDSKTEYLISKLLIELENVSIIMIAHRLSTVQHVDRIYFMDQGKLLDQGRFSDLYQRNPSFKEYVDHMKITQATS